MQEGRRSEEQTREQKADPFRQGRNRSVAELGMTSGGEWSARKSRPAPAGSANPSAMQRALPANSLGTQNPRMTGGGAGVVGEGSRGKEEDDDVSTGSPTGAGAGGINAVAATKHGPGGR